MTDLRFVHAADLHLDAPFKGVGQVAPAVASALREASLQAFDRLIDLCLERDAAFLVLAGDLYDGPDHGLRAQLRLRDGLARLSDAGIWTFIAHGNHDPLELGWSAVRESWPERAIVFPAGEIAAHAVTRGDETVAVVQGISYWRRDVTENLALRFRRIEGPGLQVGVLHCNVGGGTGHADYSPCTADDLVAAGLDYWALGHVHKRTVLSGTPYGEQPWIVYPGSLQSRSPKPSERGPKGASVVDVRGGRVASVEHVDCDSVRFQLIEVDVGALAESSVAAVRDALSAAAAEALIASEGRPLVLRGRLSGRTSLSSTFKRPGAQDELIQSLRDGCQVGAAGTSSVPFTWWDSIVDETSPVLDRRVLASSGDFVADLVAASDRLVESLGEAPAVFAASVSDGLPPALQRRAEDLLVDDGFLGSDIVRQATEIALDGLGVGLEEVGS